MQKRRGFRGITDNFRLRVIREIRAFMCALSCQKNFVSFPRISLSNKLARRLVPRRK